MNVRKKSLVTMARIHGSDVFLTFININVFVDWVFDVEVLT
jgi:hypothetical protein